MSEPTIGEMLEWLDELRRWVAGEPVRELAAIRAFVERVGARFVNESGLYIEIVAEELAAMEKQNAGTND
jgi:hypothetical protein